jgi:hypothetical protein
MFNYNFSFKILFYKYTKLQTIERVPSSSSSQYSANEVGLLNDKGNAYEVTRGDWHCCVMKYCYANPLMPIKIGCLRLTYITGEGCDLYCKP